MIEENHNYRDFLEKMKIEFGDFLRLCEAGRTIRHAALKARKQSIKLRQILKDFRPVSLENDRRITSIILEAKNRIRESNL